MNDCIFCKIIDGAIPSYKIYEDDDTYAFLDNSDQFEGHTLVVPKKHCADLTECSDECLAAVIKTVRKIARHYIDDCGYDGVNLFNCTREAAGQSVFHLHIHIIPRRGGDGLAVCPTHEKIGCDFAAVAKKLAISD